MGITEKKERGRSRTRWKHEVKAAMKKRVIEKNIYE